MRQNTYVYIGFIALIISIGCKKEWLDVKADKTQAIPATLKDFQSMLDFSESNMNSYAFSISEIASDGHYITETAWGTATSGTARNAYTWSQTQPYLSLSTNWDRTYLRIFTCNVVLEGLKKISTTNQSENDNYNNIKGQALFSRAEAFQMLSQIYAQPYVKGSASVDLGIPLRLTADVTEKSIRSTVQETYNRIIDDLMEAELLLPALPLARTRGSKAAVYALLARVYLTMDEFETCLNYAKKSLVLHDQLLDFNAVAAAGNFIGGITSKPANPEILIHYTINTGSISNFLTTNYLVDLSLYNEYEADDLRRTLYFKSNANGTKTFKGNYFSSTTNLFAGIATDEVLLMRAECYARTGNVQLAMDDLNTLMRKRWDNKKVFTIIMASNADDALRKILIERRKELILRGLRWTDLRRLNKDDRFKVTLTRSIGGSTYTLEPGSYRYTFPIPNNVIEISGMPQTENW